MESLSCGSLEDGSDGGPGGPESISQWLGLSTRPVWARDGSGVSEARAMHKVSSPLTDGCQHELEMRHLGSMAVRA